MKVVHRISFGRNDAMEAIVEELHIHHMKNPLPQGHCLVTFEIDESDPRWERVATLVRDRKLPDIINTVFTREEILRAEWVRLVPRFVRDYPQPEDDMMWKQITYEQTCPSCGVGYRQKAPFRLAREPRLGKHDFYGLFWAHTVFCTPRILEVLQAHEIRGYEAWRPHVDATGQPSQVVCQLLPCNVAGPGLAEVDKQDPERCPRCGITKYAFHAKGYMHIERKALRTGGDMQFTQEWFGSDTRSGYREILISDRFARLIVEHGWRGAELKPIELV